MNKIYIIIFFLTLFSTRSLSQHNSSTKYPGYCESYLFNGNEVIFNCENNVKVSIKLCSNSIVKVWYSPDGRFEQSNDSFAVINETPNEVGPIDIEESPSIFEITTDALRIHIDRNPFQLKIFNKDNKLLLEDYKQKGHFNQNDKIASYKVLRDNEHFFGLGEKAGSLDRRGRKYKMWNSDKPCYGVNEDPLYKSIPFFISSYNYGIFFDNTHKTEFDFGVTSNEYFSFGAPGGEMIYYFIYGNDYKEIINGYTQLTGKPIMPPKWALGFSQSRGLLTNEDLTRQIAKGYRDRNIPCDIIYQDIGWVEQLQNFEWDPAKYIDPAKMINDLDQQGFKVIVSQDPVISQGNKQWHEADSSGYFAADARTGKTYDMPWPWGGNCGVVDFTNPDVAHWWGAYQQKPIDDGVRGFWTDMGEPAWSNEESTDRLFMEHHLGSHEEIHNVYGLTWDKVVTEQFERRNPNQRIFQMTRAGYAGMQRYTFGWSGDTGNGYNVTEGWQQLANQIPVALSAGMGLIPFWSCDISGYCRDIHDYQAFSELYVRWLQFGAFNPLSRIHHEGNNAVEPWLFGSEAEKIAKESIELKYQLFPYIYTYAREAYDTGMPLMRAMMLEYPNDPEVYKAESQFLFGEELLVAPVVEKGALTKSIYLPEGNWVDYKDGQTIYHGSGWIEYPVTLKDLPLLVKQGSVIPTMPVMQYIHETPNYPIILKVFPAHNAREVTFELYEDDGTTNDYKEGVYCTTSFSCTTTRKGYEISISDRHLQGYAPAENRNLVFEVYLEKQPASVVIDNKKVELSASDELMHSIDTDFNRIIWGWDKDASKCIIKVPDSGKEKTIKINE